MSSFILHRILKSVSHRRHQFLRIRRIVFFPFLQQSIFQHLFSSWWTLESRLGFRYGFWGAESSTVGQSWRSHIRVKWALCFGSLFWKERKLLGWRFVLNSSNYVSLGIISSITAPPHHHGTPAMFYRCSQIFLIWFSKFRKKRRRPSPPKMLNLLSSVDSSLCRHLSDACTHFPANSNRFFDSSLPIVLHLCWKSLTIIAYSCHKIRPDGKWKTFGGHLL